MDMGSAMAQAAGIDETAGMYQLEEWSEVAQPLRLWHEDMGPRLWWAKPVQEPPYVGTPLDGSWPGYHTHFTPLRSPTRFVP
jgi:hypothetical protein